MDLKFKNITSPNKSKRSNGIKTVRTGMVHWTGSTAGAVAIGKYFAIDSVDVSSHDVIGRDALVVRCVPFELKAWHAGHSRYDFNRDGKFNPAEYNLNDTTVGWELCHKPGQDWPDIQIRALAQRIRRANAVCPNFAYKHIIDHEAASHALSGKWDVDSTFPAYKMFWWVLHGPDATIPHGVIEKLPDWAVRQAKLIKKEF